MILEMKASSKIGDFEVIIGVKRSDGEEKNFNWKPSENYAEDCTNLENLVFEINTFSQEGD